jgi:methyl-accepting chemotaxis protein
MPFALNSIKARLTTGLALILALLLGVAALSIVRLQQAASAARYLQTEVAPTKAASDHVALLMQRYRMLEYAHLGALVPEDHAGIEALMAEVNAALANEFKQLSRHPELQAPAASGMPKLWHDYAGVFDDAIKKDSHEGMANIAIRRMAGEHESQFKNLLGTLKANGQQLEQAVAASNMASETISAQTQQIIVSTAVLALLSGAVIGVYLVRQIMGPLNRTIAFANDIASGNLSAHLDGQADGEMRHLVQALQAMRDNLVSLVRQTRDGVSQVQLASGEIAASAGDLSARTEQQASHVTESAHTLTSLTQDIRDATEVTSSVQQLVTGSLQQATQTGQLVRHVTEGMDGITQTALRIGEIVQTIDAIAFQTNILALNAAVEAACAGEHGRGFAVVASEVRVLAQRCASAARDVKALAEDARERARAGEGSTRQASEAVAVVVQQVNQIAGFITQLTAQSQQQLGQLEYVHQSVLVIDDMTQRNSALSEQSAAAASALRDHADVLGRSVAKFRISPT